MHINLIHTPAGGGTDSRSALASVPVTETVTGAPSTCEDMINMTTDKICLWWCSWKREFN